MLDVMRRSIAVLDVPTGLGLSAQGVRAAPRALRQAGLLARLDALDAGELEVEASSPLREPRTALLNPVAIERTAVAQADRVAALMAEGRFPLVLGGDDSVLFGNLLACLRLGEIGLAYFDAHTDFYPPDVSPTGEASDSSLFLVTGRGPSEVTGGHGFAMVEDRNVAVLGHRDRQEQLECGSADVRTTAMLVRDLDELRTVGTSRTNAETLGVVAHASLAGFWIHLDCDVLDHASMPAVDYRLPGGLLPDELIELLSGLLRSPRALGMSLSIFNPELDLSGAAAPLLVNVLASAFERACVR
jgi:arginase